MAGRSSAAIQEPRAAGGAHHEDLLVHLFFAYSGAHTQLVYMSRAQPHRAARASPSFRVPDRVVAGLSRGLAAIYATFIASFALALSPRTLPIERS